MGEVSEISKKIVVVIPAFNVEKQIEKVISSIPSYISKIIVVDDCSTDQTHSIVSSYPDDRIILVKNEKNLGVGGAMISGFSVALHIQADVIVKIDGDGQMDPRYIPYLVNPILAKEADYSKGNRFVFIDEFKTMPFIRKLGNLGLSFLVKIASGYWNIVDPTNGYTAINREKLLSMNPDRIAKSYFFESSMLCELRRLNAVVADIPIPAIYAGEKSSIKYLRETILFSRNIFQRSLNRLINQYFFLNFSAFSFYLVIGYLLSLFGLIFGIIKWHQSSLSHIPTNSGSVILAAVPFILGIQFIIQAISLDILSVPQKVTSIPEHMYQTKIWEIIRTKIIE